jgi:hypothetical protein
MRTLGPGSVSSLLKIGLDVFWWVLVGLTVLVALAVLAALALPRLPQMWAPARDATGGVLQIPVTRPLLVGRLTLLAVYCAILLLIVRTLRRIFLTLVAGDPFRPENVGRLRGVGLGLAALAALNLVTPRLESLFIPGLVRSAEVWPELTPWFSVVVIFVLAEVFREGARLRREAELTI